MSHSRHVQRRHTWMRTFKLEELEQRLLLNGDPGISSVQASYSLADLDGTNGFVLEGIDVGDTSGGYKSLSTAGDVNGDGYDDILIGARGADPGGDSLAGETYVVFGKSGSFGASVDIGALDGTNGFVLQAVDATAANFSEGDSTAVGTPQQVATPFPSRPVNSITTRGDVRSA